jgi:hypothetical protein
LPVIGSTLSLLGASVALVVSVQQWIAEGGLSAEPPVGDMRKIAYAGMAGAMVGGALLFYAMMRHDFHPRWMHRVLLLTGLLLTVNVPNLTIFGVLLLGYAVTRRAFFSDRAEGLKANLFLLSPVGTS